MRGIFSTPGIQQKLSAWSIAKSIFSEEVPTAAGVIQAVPIGLDPREPLLLCENWSDVLLHEVLKRVQIK